MEVSGHVDHECWGHRLCLRLIDLSIGVLNCSSSLVFLLHLFSIGINRKNGRYLSFDSQKYIILREKFEGTINVIINRKLKCSTIQLSQEKEQIMIYKALHRVPEN